MIPLLWILTRHPRSQRSVLQRTAFARTASATSVPSRWGTKSSFFTRRSVRSCFLYITVQNNHRFIPSRASARVSDYELFIGYIWKDLLVRTRPFLLHAGGSLSSALYCLTFILIPPHPRPPSLVSDLPSLPHPHSSIRPSRPTSWLIGRRRKLSLWRVVSLLRV